MPSYDFIIQVGCNSIEFVSKAGLNVLDLVLLLENGNKTLTWSFTEVHY